MIDTQTLIGLGQEHLFQNYRQPDLVLVRGEGVRVTDRAGKTYFDLIAGIATCVLGHCHPKVSAALKEQVDRLWHVSNLFWSEPQILLAQRLTSTCFADRVFLCNSGTEANEGAIKLARRWQHDQGHERHEIVTFEGSFHGRTFASLAATAQPKYHEGFGPMPQGFRYVPFGDLGALSEAVGPRTAAVMIEPIQGEAGVRTPPEGFLASIRALTQERGALLIFDEVQSGMGRTGRMWAHQWDDVTPDIMTCAKALGNGFPIGALLAREEVARSFVPGTHATTFGGNPLACTAANATLSVLLDDGVLEDSAKVIEHLWQSVESKLVGRGVVTGLRGRGLWVALEVTQNARELLGRAIDAGVLVNAIGDDLIRLAPPLTITPDEIDAALDLLAQAWA